MKSSEAMIFAVMNFYNCVEKPEKLQLLHIPRSLYNTAAVIDHIRILSIGLELACNGG